MKNNRIMFTFPFLAISLPIPLKTLLKDLSVELSLDIFSVLILFFSNSEGFESFLFFI